jgi:general secretion pathway protein N
MKKRWLPYVIFGLVFYLLFLIIEMPASWFAWGLNRYSGGTVRLDPMDGSLWHGKGKLVIYYPQTMPHDLGNTEWSVNPFWLLTGRIQSRWNIESSDGRAQSILRISASQIHLLETQVTFPAQTISTFYSPASLISPQGQVQLRTDKLAIGKGTLEGNVEVLWNGAGSSLTPVQPLGNYRLEITGAGKTAALKLSTSQGALDLTGQGQWQIQTGQLQLTGTATPLERAAELEPLLKLIGQDQGNGKRALILNTRLPAILPLR